MPRSSFFAKLGLFAVNDFLDAQTRAQLRMDVSAARISKATIEHGAIDENFRRTGWAEDVAEAANVVGSRLSLLRPELERHFEVALTGWEEPQFLIYQPGGFYRPHRDVWTNAEAPEYMRVRKVSVVIFLNDESPVADDGYAGGNLTFFGLINDPPSFKDCGLPLTGEAGLLIAFRSDILHEVTPVIAGTRHTVVSWFY